MFVDIVKIHIKAGDGGNGAVSLDGKSTSLQEALTEGMEEMEEMWYL